MVFSCCQCLLAALAVAPGFEWLEGGLVFVGCSSSGGGREKHWILLPSLRQNWRHRSVPPEASRARGARGMPASRAEVEDWGRPIYCIVVSSQSITPATDRESNDLSANKEDKPPHSASWPDKNDTQPGEKFPGTLPQIEENKTSSGLHCTHWRLRLPLGSFSCYTGLELSHVRQCRCCTHTS